MVLKIAITVLTLRGYVRPHGDPLGSAVWSIGKGCSEVIAIALTVEAVARPRSRALQVFWALLALVVVPVLIVIFGHAQWNRF